MTTCSLSLRGRDRVRDMSVIVVCTNCTRPALESGYVAPCSSRFVRPQQIARLPLLQWLQTRFYSSHPGSLFRGVAAVKLPLGEKAPETFTDGGSTHDAGCSSGKLTSVWSLDSRIILFALTRSLAAMVNDLRPYDLSFATVV